MTVAELIEKLTHLPQDADVYYYDTAVGDGFTGTRFTPSICLANKVEVDKDGDIIIY